MFQRYAIFFTPTGPLAAFGASWLGWDSAAGRHVAQMRLPQIDVAGVTATPRKYGLHGTLKAPFRLAPPYDLARLERAAADFAMRHSPVDVGPLELRNDTGFVALRPKAPSPRLHALAAAIVRDFNPFCAPLSPADIARRRTAGLTPRQDQQMKDWGYPFVFDDFHFHLTLTGAVSQDAAALVIAALKPLVAKDLTATVVIDAITVMGQDDAGLFHQLHRIPLRG